MFLWYPVLDLARAPRRTARKKGSGYENGFGRAISPESRLQRPENKLGNFFISVFFYIFLFIICL